MKKSPSEPKARRTPPKNRRVAKGVPKASTKSKITLLEVRSRYLVAPIITTSCAMIYAYPIKDLDSQKLLNGSAAASFSLILGTLYYTPYRAIVYDKVICPFLDMYCKKTSQINYRIYLRNEYGISKGDAAERFYAVVRPYIPELNDGTKKRRSIEIHASYQAALIFLLFSLFSIDASLPKTGLFITLGFLCLLSALIADIKIDQEISSILRIRKATVDEIAVSQGLKQQRLEGSEDPMANSSR